MNTGVKVIEDESRVAFLAETVRLVGKLALRNASVVLQEESTTALEAFISRWAARAIGDGARAAGTETLLVAFTSLQVESSKALSAVTSIIILRTVRNSAESLALSMAETIRAKVKTSSAFGAFASSIILDTVSNSRCASNASEEESRNQKSVFHFFWEIFLRTYLVF